MVFENKSLNKKSADQLQERRINMKRENKSNPVKFDVERVRASIDLILKAVPAGIIVLEKPDGRITYVNDRAVELY